MRILFGVIAILIAVAAPSTAQQFPDAPSESRYPHAMFILESTALTIATIEDGRAYSSSEYYDSNGIEHHRSAGRYAAINVPISLAAGLVAWKLERSPRRPLRILGHAIMWSAIAAHSTLYFTRGSD